MVAVVCCLASAVVAPAAATTETRTDTARPQAPPPPARPTPPVRQPVSIETLSPAQLRPGTPVRVSGTVFNTTNGVWGDAQVGMLAAGEPFTSPAQLADATRADPYDDFTGEQVLEPGTFADIGDVPPGQSRSFTFTVPYGALGLSGSDGVYWVGAELRATDGQGERGSVARTLTFMPHVSDPERAPVVDLAMLWPVTAPVPWNGQQFVNRSLSRQLVPGGRLRAIGALGASAGNLPLTWVLDPAVLDAAGQMSDGFRQAGTDLGPRSAPATGARAWLRTVRNAAGNSVALAVPYGHPDVAALAHADIRPGMRKAGRASERVLDQLGVARLDLMWPAAGRATQTVLDASEEFGPDLALLSRGTFENTPRHAVVDVRTHDTQGERRGTRSLPSLVVDRDHSRLGLRAQPGQTALQWRQLILANTALRSLYGDQSRRTAVAMPSSRWWPDATWPEAGLFRGLQVPWVRMVSVTGLLSRPHPTYRGEYNYPPAARDRELGAPLLDTIRKLRRTTRTVTNLLADQTEIRAETDKAFGLAASSAWRAEGQTGRRVAEDFLAANRSRIRGIDLETPDFVTLSSSSGRFPLSVTNRLDEAVTIRLQVRARDPRMTVEPIGPVTLQRDQRVTVSVVTNSRGVGITTLTAHMRTQEGKPFGKRASFQVRTTQIGAVVWVIMGLGATVLFVAAGRRIVRRVRAYRRSLRGTR
jgi:Family of unknown function (DUF6049)